MRYLRLSLLFLVLALVAGVNSQGQYTAYPVGIDRLWRAVGDSMQSTRVETVIIGGGTSGPVKLVGTLEGSAGTADSAAVSAYADSAAVSAYSDSAAVAAYTKQCETFTWLEPDVVAIIDTVVTFRYFDATTFPAGCTIDELIADASASITDTLIVYEWDDPVGTSKSVVDTIIFSAANQVQITSGFDDADIAVDAHLALDFDSPIDNYTVLKLTVIYTKD